jgi:hypothetical protein
VETSRGKELSKKMGRKVDKLSPSYPLPNEMNSVELGDLAKELPSPEREKERTLRKQLRKVVHRLSRDRFELGEVLATYKDLYAHSTPMGTVLPCNPLDRKNGRPVCCGLPGGGQGSSQGARGIEA